MDKKEITWIVKIGWGYESKTFHTVFIDLSVIISVLDILYNILYRYVYIYAYFSTFI